MSILIRGMAMPTSCRACHLKMNCDDCEGYECVCVPLHQKIGYLGDLLTDKRRDDCPLIPAADVRPVVRGKWLNDFCGKGRFSKRIMQCSLCGNFLDLDGVNAGRGDANYCPNCGADMREPPKED